jgi:hypothetical protein
MTPQRLRPQSASSRPGRLPIVALPGLACAAALFCGGCGYQQSGSMKNAAPGYEWNSLYRTDVRTVAVPIFTNKSFYRGVEFHLSKAIVSNLEAQTPYKVVPRERADTLLEGEITRVRARTISDQRRAAIPQEQLYLVTVNFTWKDLRTGKILAQQRNFEQASHWYPTLGEGAFVAEQQNVERLAQAIVHELQAQW